VDEEPERIYPGYDSAMEELGREGWGVIDGPMMLRSVDPGFRRSTASSPGGIG
jgi:hypothetical protein